MDKQPLNRKMKLTLAQDTNGGAKFIGCRASGIHKGYHIERTAWQPVANFADDSFRMLETLATGRYNAEVRAIDNQLKQKS